MREILGRLTGAKPGNSLVIHLVTSFGGGKIHNPIALYHVAKGASSPASVADLIPPEYLLWQALYSRYQDMGFIAA